MQLDLLNDLLLGEAVPLEELSPGPAHGQIEASVMGLVEHLRGGGHLLTCAMAVLTVPWWFEVVTLYRASGAVQPFEPCQAIGVP